jgi:hypothetical protein
MTPLVVRMTIINDATTWSVTYKCHSDDSRGVIYSCNIFYNTGPHYFFWSKLTMKKQRESILQFFNLFKTFFCKKARPFVPINQSIVSIGKFYKNGTIS